MGQVGEALMRTWGQKVVWVARVVHERCDVGVGGLVRLGGMDVDR